MLVDCCSSLCLAHCFQRLAAAAFAASSSSNSFAFACSYRPLLRLLRRGHPSPASSLPEHQPTPLFKASQVRSALMTCGLYSRWNPSVISAHSLPPLCWPPEQPVGGEIVTFPQTLPLYRYSGVKSLWCFNTVGGEILTFPDTPTTQGLSLWCFNTVRDPRGQLTAVKGCRPMGRHH